MDIEETHNSHLLNLDVGLSRCAADQTHYSPLSEIRLNDDGLIAGRHALAC
jgi:hypothetical protein